MENKQIATVRKITGELIGGFILYGIVFGILYDILYNSIANKISENYILLAIIAIILQGIIGFCIWRCSIATTFRNRLIEKNNVKTVMKNLIIFTVIICILTAIINFSKVNQTVEEAINSNAQIALAEKYMKYIYDEDEIAIYEIEKEKIINETKTKLYTYLAILEIGLTAMKTSKKCYEFLGENLKKDEDILAILNEQ